MITCFLCRILYQWERGCIAHDNIGQLCAMVESCGGTMTFYGQPVEGPDDLRAKAHAHAIERLATVLR